MDKNKMDAWKRLSTRAEKAIAKTGRSIHKLTKKELQDALMQSKVMDKNNNFIDENGNVVSF